MPKGDGTGPLGEGPRTGRGLGKCSGGKGPGYEDTKTPRRRPRFGQILEGWLSGRKRRS